MKSKLTPIVSTGHSKESSVGLAVVGEEVVGLAVVGDPVVGEAVVGLAVVGLADVGLGVVGDAVVGFGVGHVGYSKQMRMLLRGENTVSPLLATKEYVLRESRKLNGAAKFCSIAMNLSSTTRIWKSRVHKAAKFPFVPVNMQFCILMKSFSAWISFPKHVSVGNDSRNSNVMPFVA